MIKWELIKWQLIKWELIKWELIKYCLIIESHHEARDKSVQETYVHGQYQYLYSYCLLNISSYIYLQKFFVVVVAFLAFDYCRFCVIMRVFHPRHNGQWPLTSKDFLSQILSITFFAPSLFLRKRQYFPFQCCVPNKGTTGTIFITSLVWRGPWLGIEPGTSHTRSHHSTTRLSRRRYLKSWILMLDAM